MIKKRYYICIAPPKFNRHSLELSPSSALFLLYNHLALLSGRSWLFSFFFFIPGWTPLVKLRSMSTSNLIENTLQPRVTLYTAGHLHTAVPHCSHSRAPIVHTAVPRENNEHGCVYLRCRAVCKLPGCVEGHPWQLSINNKWSVHY